MAPNHAFLVLLVGMLGVYAEFIWPGRIISGLTGSLLVVAGAYFLWQNPLDATGLALIGIAVALFVAEVFWRVDLVAGIGGAIALTCGFCLLLDAPRRITPALAIPASLGFGGLTLFLSYAAKRARRNKWSDIEYKGQVSRK